MPEKAPAGGCAASTSGFFAMYITYKPGLQTGGFFRERIRLQMVAVLTKKHDQTRFLVRHREYKRVILLITETPAGGFLKSY